MLKDGFRGLMGLEYYQNKNYPNTLRVGYNQGSAHMSDILFEQNQWYKELFKTFEMILVTFLKSFILVYDSRKIALNIKTGFQIFLKNENI